MMKKLTVFAIAAAVLLFAGNAMAVPATLYDILGYSGTEVYKDTGAEAAQLVDTDGSYDDATAFLFLEAAGFASGNNFGIYGYTHNGDGTVSIENTLEVFQGSQFPLDSITLEFDLVNGTITNKTTDVSAEIGTTFGFYLEVTDSQQTYYSHTSLNADGFDHLMLFNTIDNSVGQLLGSNIVLAWEDLYGGGDQDFDDMVVGISDVEPVPEPGTLLLIGSGLVALVGLRKRMK